MELNEMDGEVKLTRVGPNLLENEKPQHTVPPYMWFGSFPTKDITISEDGSQIEVTRTARDAEKHYSLIGVTCAPAFQYEDSESAKRSDMLAKFPKYEPLISLLTIPDWAQYIYCIYIVCNVFYEMKYYIITPLF